MVDFTNWWIGSSIGSIPTVTWQRIVFTALVVVSFYLGLTALLAIPLLNEKSRSQHTVDDVAKALEVYLIKLGDFPPQLPPVSLPASLPQDSSSTPNSNLAAMQMSNIKSVSDLVMAPMVENLQKKWIIVRSNAEDIQRRGALTARNLFAAALDGNFGKQHTDRYYYDLLKWFSDTMVVVQTTLLQCHDGATKFIGDSSQVLVKFKSALDQHADDTAAAFREYNNDTRRLMTSSGRCSTRTAHGLICHKPQLTRRLHPVLARSAGGRVGL